MSQASLDAL